MSLPTVESRVWIETIRPIGIHGFMGERSLEGLQPGLNLIYGPNAIGKSTLAKAITLVFQPKGLGSSGRVTGLANDGGATVTLDINARQSTWNGFPEQRGRYLLDIAGLLEGMNKDELNAITRLIGSGLRKPEPVKPKPRKKCEPLDKIREIRRSRNLVLEDENRLVGLKNQLAQAERAQNVIDQVDRLLRRRELEQTLQNLNEQIATLLEEHPGLEKLSPNAADQLRKERAGYERCLREVQAAQDRLDAEGIDANTSERVLRTSDASLLGSLADEIGQVKSALDVIQQSVTKFRTECTKARDDLAKLTGWQPEGLPSFTGEDVERFRQIAAEEDDYKREALKAEAYRRVLERWTQNHGGKSLPNADAVKTAITDWLNVEPRIAAAAGAEQGKLLSVMFVAAIAVLTIIVALLPNSIPAMVKVIGLGGVSAVLAYLAGKSKKPEGTVSAGETLAEARARVARDPLSKNSSPGEVLNWMQKVADTEALAKAEDLIKALQVAEPAIPSGKRLLEEKGVQGETISLRAASDALHTYQESQKRLATEEAELERKRARLADLRQQLRDLFSANGYRSEAVEVEREIDGLKARFSLIQKLDEAAGNFEAAKESLNSFWKTNGFESVLEEDREETLVHRAELHERLSQLKTERSVNEQNLARLKTSDVPGEWELLNADDLDGIRAKQERLAAEHTDLAGKVREIENEVARAQKNEDYQRLAEELAEDQRAREGLFQNQARAIVKYRLHRFLLDELKTQSVPPLIERANDYLGRFSNNRYRLSLNPDVKEDELGNLRLRDRTTGRTQAFNELSTGTKMHSLIAIRLGLIDLQEESANGGTRKFPVVADEVLAVSDPEASRAVAEALREISRERQVIVFTNQPDDVAVFESVDPSVNVRPLVVEAIPEPVGGSLMIPEYGELPRPRRMNLAIPLDAHDPEAFGSLAAEEPNLERILVKLEPLREELLANFPRLTWEAIEAGGVITPATRENLAKAFEASGSSARTFLASLAEHGVPAGRRDRVDAFLNSGGYLADPPAVESLKSRVRELLGDDGSGFVVEFFAAVFRQSVS